MGYIGALTKCSVKRCPWNALWSCRVCDKPYCKYHSKNKAGDKCDCGNHARRALEAS